MKKFLSFLSRLWSMGATVNTLLVILISLILIGLVEPFLPLAEYKNVASGPRRVGPSIDWIFGTDNLGRSVFARVLEGIRLTFLLSLTAVLGAGIVGAIIGMAAAWYRGWV